MMRMISLKLDEKQMKLLEKISKETHIPKSALIRQGIDLILKRSSEDRMTAEFRKEVDAIVTEDISLLKKLAK